MCLHELVFIALVAEEQNRRQLRETSAKMVKLAICLLQNNENYPKVQLSKFFL